SGSRTTNPRLRRSPDDRFENRALRPTNSAGDASQSRARRALATSIGPLVRVTPIARSRFIGRSPWNAHPGMRAADTRLPHRAPKPPAVMVAAGPNAAVAAARGASKFSYGL